MTLVRTEATDYVCPGFFSSTRIENASGKQRRYQIQEDDRANVEKKIIYRMGTLVKQCVRRRLFEIFYSGK